MECHFINIANSLVNYLSLKGVGFSANGANNVLPSIVRTTRYNVRDFIWEIFKSQDL
jgi:hypothetical protein